VGLTGGWTCIAGALCRRCFSSPSGIDPLPYSCESVSNLTLDSFTATFDIGMPWLSVLFRDSTSYRPDMLDNRVSERRFGILGRGVGSTRVGGRDLHSVNT
jgi:hypothetical protein